MKTTSLAECLSCKYCGATRIDQDNDIEVFCGGPDNGPVYPQDEYDLVECDDFIGFWEKEDGD